jgi:hypothetical protein
VTLTECIQRHESAQESRQTAVTPLDAAIAVGSRFVAAICALDDRERATVLSTILDELRAIEPATA